MAFNVGTGTVLQVGKEASFNPLMVGAMTELVNLTSESIKVSVEKGDEGSLLESKTAMSRDLLGINVDGSVSFILRPEFAGRLLQAAMGGTDKVTLAGPEAEGFHKHTLTLCDPSADLPSLAFTIQRGSNKNTRGTAKAYTGCTIGTLSIDAAAGDYVKGSIDIKGTEEKAGVIAKLPGFAIPSYRCTDAKFILKKSGEVISPEEQTACISNASFKIDNALEDAPKTYCTGLLKGQPAHGLRNVTIDVEVPYTKDIDTLKDTYLTKEQTAIVYLKFTSTDEKYFIEITMPNVCITDVTANVGGTGLINASISGMALSTGDEEPVTVVIQDKHEQLY